MLMRRCKKVLLRVVALVVVVVVVVLAAGVGVAGVLVILWCAAAYCWPLRINRCPHCMGACSQQDDRNKCH